MPFITDFSFQPIFVLRNKHINTLYRYAFSNTKTPFKRQRITTHDNDFIDLDFKQQNADKIVVVIHGLEGSSDSGYIHTIADTLSKAHFDICAFNMRSCSGEPNKLLSSYHSGKTEDLLEVISFLEKNYNYKQIHIIGYSLGGNLTLKFMGEFANRMPQSIVSAVGVSVPCDLEGSVISISKYSLYENGFLKTLKEKAIQKSIQFPNSGIDVEKIKQCTNFYEFDDLYTAPIHGFKNAKEYWKTSSCKQFIPKIKLPTLLISSKDDPFLNAACFPIKEAQENKHFTFIQTKYGGHLGFITGFKTQNQRWLENTILAFIKKQSY